MRYRQVLSAGVVLITFAVTGALAIPGHLPNLEKAADESTLIVMGEVVSAQKGVRSSVVPYGNRRIPAHVDRATLHIDANMRRAVSFALMRIATPNTVKALRKAMKDSDIEVRYNGAFGMAEALGEKSWRPTREQFQADENKYIIHWAR